MWRPVDDTNPVIVLLTLLSLVLSLVATIGILVGRLQAWDVAVGGLGIVLATVVWTIPTHRIEIWDESASDPDGGHTPD
jgi:uncharacterized membrane protein YhaH (DUF805 family)